MASEDRDTVDTLFQCYKDNVSLQGEAGRLLPIIERSGFLGLRVLACHVSH